MADDLTVKKENVLDTATPASNDYVRGVTNAGLSKLFDILALPLSTAASNALALKANLASPALTGTPTAPTAATATSTTQVATTAFVHAVLSAATAASFVLTGYSPSPGAVSASDTVQGAFDKIATGIGIITDATTARTLALTDAGQLINFTSASAVTVTIPAYATVAFPIGTVIALRQGGAGTVTVAAASGVTLNDSAATADQAKQIALVCVAQNEWDPIGQLA